MTDTRKEHRTPRRAVEPVQAAEPAGDDKERVAKVMARAGLCSRRDAEAWIREGRVAINGAPITSPALNIGPDDVIAVDGRPIATRERTRLFLYHKPRGLVTTAKDPEGRATVFDALPEELPRLISVGRLDINTEGLLLLTNDGGLARMLELPATGWLRRYRVRANGSITQDRLDALKEGVTIEGVDYAGIEATLDRNQGANVWITMGLREGKNREIKRVLEDLGLYVNRLIRLSFGPFQLGDLAEGEVEEVRQRVLKDQLGEALAREAGVTWEDAIKAEVVTREVAQKDREAPRTREARSSGRPSSREAEERPRLDRPKPGARPHISALRAERPKAVDEPRKRIERKTTEDRKGRTVKVEHVTVEEKGHHRGEGGTSRNARNFARDRRESEPEADRTSRRTITKPSGSAEAARPARVSRAGGFSSDRPLTGRALKDGKVRRPPTRAEGGSRPPYRAEGASRPSDRAEGGGRPPSRSEGAGHPPNRGEAGSRPPKRTEGHSRPPNRTEASSRPSSRTEGGRRPPQRTEGTSRPPNRAESGSRPPGRGGGAKPGGRPPRSGGDGPRPGGRPPRSRS